MDHASAQKVRQVEFEARARIFWGDSQDQVISDLTKQSFSAQEASELVHSIVQERASAIRRRGIRKLVVGAGLICLPVAVYFAGSGGVVFPFLRLLLLATIPGAWGLWMVFDGIVMALSPKSE